MLRPLFGTPRRCLPPTDKYQPSIGRCGPHPSPPAALVSPCHAGPLKARRGRCIRWGAGRKWGWWRRTARRRTASPSPARSPGGGRRLALTRLLALSRAFFDRPDDVAGAPFESSSRSAIQSVRPPKEIRFSVNRFDWCPVLD